MRSIFSLIVVLFLSHPAYSQTSDITPEEMDSYKARCIEYMNAFQKGLEIIADKSKSDAVKQHQKNILLTFFMGEGEPWQDSAGHSYPAVEMEVSTLRYGKAIEKPHSIPIKKYFNNLQNLRYKQVKITQAKNCVISNLYKVGDHYEATVTYFQFFEGDRGDGTFYRDMTQKDVKVYLTKVTDGNLGTFWDLKFGDIKVVETIKV